MTFLTKDDMSLDKQNEISNEIKETLNIKFHSVPVYDKKYIKVKVREFNGVIKINLLRDKIPKEVVHYACIACITIDSVMRREKMNYPQVYLEEYKYKIKKIQMIQFINTELELDSELELESGTELEAKLESDSNSEQLQYYFTLYCCIDGCFLNGCFLNGCLQPLNKSKTQQLFC